MGEVEVEGYLFIDIILDAAEVGFLLVLEGVFVSDLDSCSLQAVKKIDVVPGIVIHVDMLIEIHSHPFEL